MVPPRIKNHRIPNQRKFNEFYLISKGANVGLPSLDPTYDCFSVQCINRHSFIFYFCISLANFKSGNLSLYKRPGVSQYLLMSDLRKSFRNISYDAYCWWLKYHDVFEQGNPSFSRRISLQEYAKFAEPFFLSLALRHSGKC